jgi:hypothetical protein
MEDRVDLLLLVVAIVGLGAMALTRRPAPARRPAIVRRQPRT